MDQESQRQLESDLSVRIEVTIEAPTIQYSEHRIGVKERRPADHPEYGNREILREHLGRATGQLGSKHYASDFWQDFFLKPKLSRHSRQSRFLHILKDYLSVRRDTANYSGSSFQRYQERYESLDSMTDLVPIIHDSAFWKAPDVLTRQDTLQAVKELCGDEDTPTILEAGCGFGGNMYLLKHLFTPTAVISGFEYASARLASSMANLAGTEMLENLFLADVTKLDLPDDSFDVVFTHHVLEQLGQEGARLALQEMWRTCKRGMVCCEPGIQGAGVYELYRLKQLGYCRDLLKVARRLPNCRIQEFRPTTYREWPNTSFILVLEKKA